MYLCIDLCKYVCESQNPTQKRTINLLGDNQYPGPEPLVL